MVSLISSLIPYFYLHIHVIHSLRVLIPFMSFEVEFIAIMNVSPYQVTPNVWSVIMAFEITCQRLGVFLTIEVLFSFYGIKIISKSGWATLCTLQKKTLFKPYLRPYKEKKDKFMRVRGRHCASMVTAGVSSASCFPLSWIRNPKIIMGFDFDYLTLVEQEVVQILNDFEVMSTCAIITLHHGDDSGMWVNSW